MNKELTIVFSSYASEKLLNKILKSIDRNFKSVVIENSLNKEVKKNLEKRFKNVKVIIPKNNLGLAKSYNIGIKNSKTKYVFLNNPDIEISIKSIKDLIKCAKKIKNFGIISPTYKIEKIYKNYSISSPKEKKTFKDLKSLNLLEVDLIDNNFLIKKRNFDKCKFDENYFLYFETLDFCSSLKKMGEKLYVCKKIKFHHYGSSSLPLIYNNMVRKTRSFHYIWSKFYYFKKNYSYFFALKKTFPNLLRSIKLIFKNIFIFDFVSMYNNFLVVFGLLCSMMNLKSFYRPKN